MDKPLVSVLMTAYNRENYIAESIESVLSSSLKDLELIIVDDGSTDNTVPIARKYAALDSRVRLYINEVNLGDYPNRNKAASYATGKYLKYVDSDDMVYPYGLEVFAAAMEKFPDAALGISSKNCVPLQPFPHYLTPKEAYHKHFFEYGFLDFGPTGVIIRRQYFEQYGGFSGKRYIGDQELWLKLAARHPVLELASALIFWRQHEGQEYKLGLEGIDRGYFMMNLPLLRDTFNDAACPLTSEQKNSILKIREKEYVRALIKHVIKTGELTKARTAFNSLKLSLTDAF
ncbi:MAG: glycosyltransferase family 2 protein [Chitinophagaceae bacterium]|nr:glycosyltransferase family 2 protein [Chitinophagaceae bacterium]